MPGQFPFGAPVLARAPSADTARPLFVLGAYPSALHVRWTAPDGASIAAMPVDNEPEPFLERNRRRQSRRGLDARCRL